MAFSASIQAEIMPGSYAGGDYVAHVKTILTDGIPTSYGILVKYENKETSAAIFRIEELENDTTAWVQIVQTEDHLLGVSIDMAASYIGIFSRAKRILTLESQGARGCLDNLVLQESSKWKWDALSREGFRHEADGDVNSNVFTGNVDIQGMKFSAKQEVKEFVPSLYQMRSHAYDPETSSGLYLERRITFVGALLKEDNWGWRNRLLLIVMQPGASNCLFPAKILTPE